MAYRYRAISDGTLANPYRFVNKGQIIDSNTPIKASWLVDAETPPADPLPVMPVMNRAGAAVQEITIPPVPSSSQYDAHIETLKRMENKQDGISEPVKPAEPVELARLADDGGIVNPGGDGTGNQEVL